ncbi:ankyrin repeat-containing domain protein [Russula dissimulans]|nr:ankyrin repeat-containing domain protein [Russula dissimulans]
MLASGGVPPLFPINTMSTSHVSPTFQSIFDAASKQYEKKIGQDLRTHPFAAQFDHCNSPDAVLDIFQKQADVFDQAGNSDKTLVKWLNPTVRLLYMLSVTIAEGVSLTFSPAKVMFTGIDVLLTVAKDVAASRGVLIDLFERIQSFLARLNIYCGIPLTTEMTTMLGKIMAEILIILALSTKEMQERPIKKLGKRLVGRTDVEDALERLDKLTQEETRTIVAKSFEMTHGIKDAAETLKRTQSRERLQSWLSPPDPSINHNVACASHHDTTGMWFVHGSLVNEWKSNGSFLWVHGKPGCGKSILASALIEDVKAMCDRGLGTFAYFYFDFKDFSKRDIRSLLSSILIQLSDQSDEYWSILSHLYTTHRDGSNQPSEAALITCLHDMLYVDGQQPTFIIMDAVDECPNTPGLPSAREKVLNLVEDLVTNSYPDLRICITSRLEQDIRMVLEPLASCHISLHDQEGQMGDIANYVRFVVHLDRTMRRWRTEDKELVIDTLIERADGMFRWIFCQLETLRRCFPQSIRQILDNLPITLDGTYERTLLEIPEEKWKHAHRLLQCLAVSSRPLRVEELAEILSIQFDSGTTLGLITGWRPENTEDAVLSACSSLITIVNVEGSPVVQFSHFSVKEFLTSNRLATAQMRNLSRYHITLEPAHEILVKACLSTLLELDEYINKKRLKDYPLAFYAARHWFEHARFGDVSLSIRDMMGQLFDAGKPYFSAWIWLYEGTSWQYQTVEHLAERPSEPRGTPLYYSVAFGLRSATEQLISLHPDDVNPREDRIPSPLWAATSEGYVDIARLLLQHGANANYVRDPCKDWTLMHLASYDGSSKMIQLLVEHGADVNRSDADGRSPLQLASRGGHVGAIQLLLEYGANVNHHDSEFGWTPLIDAVQSGCIEALRLLLQHNADVDGKDYHGRTALHQATSIEDVDAIQVLLEHGANVDSESEFDQTPLIFAVQNGLVEVLRLLLQHNVDVNGKDNNGKTALHWALSIEDVGAIQMLLEHGAEVHHPESVFGWTPLILAIQNGRVDIVRLLLFHNADVEAEGSEGMRALHWAVYDGNFEMVWALLEWGADVHAGNGFNQTPLEIALEGGYEDIVQLMLEFGLRAEENVPTIMSIP